MAGPEGGDEEAEVREDQREEDVHADRGAVQGVPPRVCHLLPAVPVAPFRGQAGLLLRQEALPRPLHPGGLPVRLRLRLDHPQVPADPGAHPALRGTRPRRRRNLRSLPRGVARGGRARRRRAPRLRGGGADAAVPALAD